MSTADELKKVGVKVEPDVLQSQLWIESLRELGYQFRMNMCDDSIEVNSIGTVLSDAIAAEIRTQMFDRGVRRHVNAMQDAYVTEAKRNAYHPMKDYFNRLAGKWDGVDRITQLAGKLKGSSGDVEYADGRRTPIHAVYLARWLIGVIAKVLDNKQNPMWVLDGPQGIGKSLFVLWLCPDPDWFIEDAIKPDDKDCDVRLMTKLVWEVSELDATTRKADVSALKAFITKGKVTVRKAYGRNDINKPAICSMVGTINNSSSGFLVDETGNRRFMVCRIFDIDWSYREIDRDQLWAQVYHLYREEGLQPALAPEEQAKQVEINQRYELENPIEDWLRQYFAVTEDQDDTLAMGDILNHLAEKGHRLHGSERSQAMEVARALTAIGCKKVHTRTGKRWSQIVIKYAVTTL